MPKPKPNPFPHGTVLTTACGQNYFIKSDHRNGGNGEKSQWLIPEPSEVNCFVTSHTRGWVLNQWAWGLHLSNGKAAVLGRSPEGDELFIAKFVAGHPAWHGYPGNYRRKKQDRPPIQVLRAWLNARHIDKTDLSRIRRSMPCSLSA